MSVCCQLMSDEAREYHACQGPKDADLAFVVHGRLMQLHGRNILFSPVRQEIFGLNETAADIWRALEAGLSADAIAGEMARSGIAKCQAWALIDAALSEWEALDLLHPVPANSAASKAPISQLVSLAGMRFRISYDAETASAAASVFRHLEIPGTTAETSWEVAAGRNRLHLYRDRVWIGSCLPEELPTALKGHLLSEVLNFGCYEIALHAAALESAGRSLLISGRPGAGKTTLTLALASRGLAYGGDDVSLLDARGHCISLPFAPAVKAGSWPLLGTWLDDLRDAPVFRRPDGKRVRYPLPKSFRRLAGGEVGWIILLDRRRQGRTVLSPLDPVAALRGLLAGAFAGGGDLSEAGFEALVRAVGCAALYRLSYSDLADAVDVVREACR